MAPAWQISGVIHVDWKLIVFRLVLSEWRNDEMPIGDGEHASLLGLRTAPAWLN